MKRGIGLVIVALAVGATVRAADTNGWDRSVALGLTMTSGNKDSVMFTGSVQGQRAWEVDEWRLGAEGSYGKTDGDLSAARARAYFQYKRLFTARWYGTVVGEALHDAVADLSYQLMIGPGVGYYFIKSDLTKLSAGIGPSLVVEKLEDQDTKTYCALRAGERFERKLTGAAKVWQSLEILPRVDDWRKFTALAEIGVEAALTKSFSVRLVGQDRYDSQPAAGKKNNDLAVIGSLAYKF